MRLAIVPAAVVYVGMVGGMGCSQSQRPVSSTDASDGFGDSGARSDDSGAIAFDADVIPEDAGDAGAEDGGRELGSGSDTGGGGGDAHVPNCETGGWTRPEGSRFSEAYRDVLCHRLTCGPCSIDGPRSPPFATKEACLEHLTGINTIVYSNLTRENDDPTLYVVDEPELDRCLRRVESCSRPSALEEICPELDGGRLGVNACCDRRGGCGPGLACVGRTSASTGTCQPRKGVGELCTGDASVTADCQVGLRCVLGFCAELVPATGACRDSLECSDGFVCSGGRCGEGQADGESCGELACAIGFFCRDGRCAPWREEGETCVGQSSSGVSDGGCKLGLFCHDDTHTCLPLPARGEPCDEARTCRYLSRDFCNLSVDGRLGSGVCRARHPPGVDCLGEIPNMCAHESLCIGGTCREALDEPLCP